MTASIKKAYQPIMSLLAANMDCKVKTIFADIEALCSAKTGGGAHAAFHKNEAGEVVALHCSYHQKWFKPSEVEFGAKASSASGFNTMCKDGLSKWTSQLARFKKAQSELLAKVGSGEVAPTDIAQITADQEEARQEIVPMDGVTGYDTLEDLLATI